MELEARSISSSEPPALEFFHVSKTFPGVHALVDAHLHVRPGEIHALLGQNGSGKSTLIKILAGYHSPDPGGELRIRGQPVGLPLHATQLRKLGIGFVHQELGLVDELTVLDNLRVGRFEPRSGGRISWRHERERASQELAAFGLRLDPKTRVKRLRDIDRALLAIVRAVNDIEVSGPEGLLVLDEPTVYLPKESVERLFEVMRAIADTGRSVLFVTHKLGEVKEVAHRVTVLRDGRVIGTVDAQQTSEEQLIELIVGRAVGSLYPEQPVRAQGEALLVVRDLAGGMVRNFSLEAYAGEIIGVTGLVGMGSEDVPRLVYGAMQATRGEIAVKGKRVDAAKLKPRRSRRHGFAFVPANRLREGIVVSLTVGDNVTLPRLRNHYRRGWLRWGEVQRQASRLLVDFGVRPTDPRRRMATLSGGNQQKSVLAKWLQTQPSVLLLHEPTQGVDVGSRKDIFSIISEVARSGAAIIIASSEHEDLAHICNRVLVMHDGQIATELAGQNLTGDDILEASYRGRTMVDARASRKE